MKTNIIILAAIAVSSAVHAVSPPPDGGYPNQNTAEGQEALFFLTSGFDNTAVGYQALSENTTGSENTGAGIQALMSNTSGSLNTALGAGALSNNTTGTHNTASGYTALFSNTSGDDNVATGAAALQQNTTGFNNTAGGFQALFSNTTGFNNTANGVNALFANTTGFNNTASGFTALQDNTTGNNNTAEGDGALASNKTGSNNTACGISALLNNTTGKNNIALGANAGSNLTTGNNNIDIGGTGVAAEANTIRIGKQGTQKNTLVAGIFGTAVSGSTVVVNSTGKLGIATSSARFKEAIKPMDKASEAILALKPVTFRYKEEVDPDRAPQFGLVAEEVEKVNPDLVIRGEDGKVMAVRYEAVNAMLLNEFLKEHRKVEDLEKKAVEQDSLKATIAAQQKQIEALTDTVRMVSERVALSTPGPQIAANED